MSSLKKRIRKIELSLTPQQAVLLWLKDIQKFRTMPEELLWRLENLAPFRQRWKAVTDEIKKAMTGEPKENINQAVRKAGLDMSFLFFLHQRINYSLLEQENECDRVISFLALQVHTLIKEQDVSNAFIRSVQYLGTLPYPLDPETGDIAQGILHHAVDCLYVDDELIRDWIKDEPDPDAACERFWEALEALIKAGKIQSGKRLELNAIPILGFRYVPVIEGIWVDQALIELGEWGSLLEQKGYAGKRPDDESPLAMDDYYPADIPWNGQDVPKALSAEELRRYREETQKNWKRHFQGEIRMIDGRPYIRLEDYIQWDMRIYADTFDIEEGIVIRSWNDWMDSCNGELAGIKVNQLSVGSLFDSDSFDVCETTEQAKSWQERRIEEIAAMRQWIVNYYEATDPGFYDRHSDGLANRQLPRDYQSYKAKLLSWRNHAAGFLANQYATLSAVEAIQQKYFNGHPLLYPTIAEKLAARIWGMERIVTYFNNNLAEDLDYRMNRKKRMKHFALSLEEIREEARELLIGIATSWMNLAKAEAYGEQGEEDKVIAMSRKMLMGDQP